MRLRSRSRQPCGAGQHALEAAGRKPLLGLQRAFDTQQDEHAWDGAAATGKTHARVAAYRGRQPRRASMGMGRLGQAPQGVGLVVACSAANPALSIPPQKTLRFRAVFRVTPTFVD